MATSAPEAFSEDALLGGRVTLVQPKLGFRAGSDAVLLAAAIPADNGQKVLEAGCGTGAATLCLARRVPGVRVAGVELQPGLARLAAQNAIRNGLGDRVRIVAADLLNPPGILGSGYDHAMANPPYFAAGKHDVSPNAARATARSEAAEGTLGAWLDFMFNRVRLGGTVTIIHRAERMDEVIALMPGAVVLPLLAGKGKPAKRIIVRAIKGVTGEPRILAGLVLHREGGGHTDAAEAVLRHASSLEF